MARRKKPQIKGTDPSYDHSFERFRPIPNDMPPDVIVPGVTSQTTPDKSQKEPTAPIATPTRAEVKRTPKKPVRVQTNTEASQREKRSKERSQPVTSKVPAPKAEPEVNERQTTLDAAVTVEQAKKMAALESKGLKMKDIVILAGRRATERFELSSKFVPKQQAERLPMKQGYHTSKRLSGNILDAMRKEQDPLGISSDPAMARGQFELLFWSCLDEVIEELRAKF